MSNANFAIAAAILDAVALLERGEAGPAAVSDAIDEHAPALENVPDETTDALEAISTELTLLDMSYIDQLPGNEDPLDVAIASLKRVLATLA